MVPSHQSGQSDANLKPLLVDTGAGASVSTIDEQVFVHIYGEFPPKMNDGSLTSVQTVSGDTVKVY